MANTTPDISELTTLIGRLFMIGMPGTDLDEGTQSLICDYGIGGVIFFDRNIQDPVQLATLCRDIQGRAADHQGLPLLLAVDQEGGRVARLKAPFTRFPGNAAIGQHPGAVDQARDFARTTAREMALVGLNMNLAPVVDVGWGTPEAHLNGRLFGDQPDRVALLGKTVIEELQGRQIMAVAKHFPGLGRTSRDPHHELPVIEMTLEEIREANLAPFQAAVAAGVSGVMTSHAVYPALDPDHPATLSQRIVTGLLREELGFDGLVITDDLEMGAVARRWGPVHAACEAFEAGADVLLICRNQESVLEGIGLIRDRIVQGQIPMERLHQSIGRLMKARADFASRLRAVPIDEVRGYFNG